MRLAVLMMLKNEAANIEISLTSLLGSIDTLIVYDTGSTDGTMDVVSAFCARHGMRLFQKHGEFVNFAVSRNASLDFADTIEDVDYVILMDCKDRLSLKACDFSLAKAWYVDVDLWMGGKSVTKLKSVRILQNRAGYRYYGVVHEYLAVSGKIGNCDVTLTQNRDGEGRRLEKDYQVLLKDHLEHPTDSRTLFYLAQTCHESGRFREAIKYSLMRIELGGFQEEVFASYLRCGKCCQKLGTDPTQWYLKAYGHSKRAEPLAGLVEASADLHVKQMFIEKMCELEYPKDALLSVDMELYSRRRWELARTYGTKVRCPDQLANPQM